MKCEFCAEEIRDEAVVCRFCNAVRKGDIWERTVSPMASATRPKGRFTLQSAGVFFVASAAAEAFSLTSEVPLFGALRGGAVAILYHLFFLVLFCVMGAGLWTLRLWGYRALFAGTAVYTLDKLLWILDTSAQRAYAARIAGGNGDLAGLIGNDSISPLILVTSLLFLASWWGFAVYVYLHRDLFGISKPPPSASS